MTKYLVAFCLALAAVGAHAQTDPSAATSAVVSSIPATGILSAKLSANWETHALGAVGAVGYSLDQKAWLASVPITGLYAFCYLPAAGACAAAGGSFSIGDGHPTGSVDVALLSPAVVNPFQATAAGSGAFRAGVDYRQQFGSVKDKAVLLILPFQF